MATQPSTSLEAGCVVAYFTCTRRCRLVDARRT
jgi:hypothetical protein